MATERAQDIHYTRKSLQKFYEGKVENLPSIDNTTTYKNKNDLLKTLEALIKEEQISNATEIHLADTDPEQNPDDHSDHQTSSKLFQDTAKVSESDSTFMLTMLHLINQKTLVKMSMCAATWG